MLSIEPNESITFGVRYADDDVLVIEKPARVPTQPGKGHQTDTLMNGLFARYGNALQNMGKARDFGLLHRLDRDTSGLLIVALRPSAYDALREQFHQRKVRKFYWAICSGAPREPQGVVRLSLAETEGGQENTNRQKLAHVSRTGKPAITAYRVLDQSPMGCLIEARPVTGRLHQVRVHLEAIGCPILGDAFYGPKRARSAAARLMLHSHRLVFAHPRTGETLDIHTAWPRDMRRMLRDLRLSPRPVSGPAKSPDAVGPDTEAADTDTPDAQD
jgi:23S rRNA pseudouridine1911/1915/1917 synthase